MLLISEKGFLFV